MGQELALLPVLGASRRRQLQPIKRVSLNSKRYRQLLNHHHSYSFDPPFVISVLSA
jgi:hypothetical protein